MIAPEPQPTIEDRGPGEPELAVVGGIHGDEPTGVRAIERILDADLALQRGVRFVIANPPAVAADQRYLDADLNRVFPGDPAGNDREERLAARLCAVTSGLPTLSMHSTHSHPEPIALASPDHPEAFRLAARLPTPYVVDETPAVDGAFTACSTVVTLEAGCQYTDAAVETAERQARAFLAVTGALDMVAPAANPSFYRTDRPVEKPPAESYSLFVENFEPVSEGAVYASTSTDELVAERPFVPILMSECGYDTIFGYEGSLLGETFSEAMDELRAPSSASATPADRSE